MHRYMLFYISHLHTLVLVSWNQSGTTSLNVIFINQSALTGDTYPHFPLKFRSCSATCKSNDWKQLAKLLSSANQRQLRMGPVPWKSLALSGSDSL